MASGAGVAFAGALQASLSVLLTIGAGVISAQYGLMSIQAAEDMSHLCVQVLLPCLLVVNLGENLDLDTAKDYVPLISKLQKTSTGDSSHLWDRPLTKPPLNPNSLGSSLHDSLRCYRTPLNCDIPGRAEVGYCSNLVQ